MSLFEIKKAGGEFKPVPAGTYDGILTGIIDYGLQKREPYKGEARSDAVMLHLLFEIPELKQEGDGLTTIVGKKVPALVSEKSNFIKYLKALKLVKEGTIEEVEALFESAESIAGILGTAASLEIAHFVTPKGETVHYLAGATKLDPRLPQPVAVREPVVFSIKKPDINVFKNKLTKYQRNIIMNGVKSEKLPGEFHEAYAAEIEADGGNGELANGVI